MKLSIKKQKNETGLARVCQAPRGYEISIDGKDVGMVAPAMTWREVRGWYFYFRVGDILVNTCNEPLPTKEEARDEAKRQIKEILAKAK